MKHKLTDNQADSVVGGSGSYINDADKIQKIKQGICPYCGRTMTESHDNYNGWPIDIYNCRSCRKEFRNISGGWMVFNNVDDSDSGC